MFTATIAMDRKRLVLYIVLMVLHVSAFIYAYRIDELDILQLAGHTEYIPFFKYMAFLGVVMIGLDITWGFLAWKRTRDENNDLREENTSLKARLFDIQESSRKSGSSKDV